LIGEPGTVVLRGLTTSGVAIACWASARPWLTISVMPITVAQARTKQAATAALADRAPQSSGRSISRR
jgi:hypothetical protein